MLVARPRAVEKSGSGIARCFPEAALNAPCTGYRSAESGKPVARLRRNVPQAGKQPTINALQPGQAQRAASGKRLLCRFLRVQMYPNIALIAVGLQIGQIHQHQPIHAVVEIRVAAEIDKLHAARLADF